MSARRLNDSEKKEIVGLYRESGETAMSLAEQFGVSNTTISRILKAGIESREYDRLIQQKRRGSDPTPVDIAIPSLSDTESTSPIISYPSSEPVVSHQLSLDTEPLDTKPKVSSDEISSDEASSGRRLRRRRTTSDSSVPSPDLTDSTAPSIWNSDSPPTSPSPSSTTKSTANPVSSSNFTLQTRLLLPDAFAHEDPIENLPEESAIEERLTYGRSEHAVSSNTSNKPVRKVIQVGVAKSTYSEPLDELEDEDEDDLLPPVTEEIAAILEEDFDDSDDESDDDDDDQADIDDDDDDDVPSDVPSFHLQKLMQVLPLSQASIPRICYLVVDRSAELVLRPLKDFGDIGQVPLGRDQVLTLPIFDNPRVAKRFSNTRTERVIKVPDSQVFYKTANRLRSKGITYLFIDGQLYSL